MLWGVKRAGSFILLVLSHQSQEHKMTTSPCVNRLFRRIVHRLELSSKE